MLRKLLISALRNLVVGTSGEILIAWDFPARNFKATFSALKNHLAQKNIVLHQPDGLSGKYADWPHFSLAFVPNTLTKEQMDKIKLAGTLYASPLQTKKLKIFKGRADPSVCFLVWELEPKSMQKLNKMKSFIYEMAGLETPSRNSIPHVSLAVTDIKHAQELESMLGTLDEVIKRYSVTYTPKQLQIWENFRIVDIDSQS